MQLLKEKLHLTTSFSNNKANNEPYEVFVSLFGAGNAVNHALLKIKICRELLHSEGVPDNDELKSIKKFCG